MVHQALRINEYAGWLEILQLAGDTQLFPKGRVVRIADIDLDATHSLVLPDTQRLTTGGPYFYLINADDAFECSVTYLDQNILANPEDFDNANWTKVGSDPPTVTANTHVAPDGTTTADTVNFAPTTDGVSSQLSDTGLSLTTTEPHYMSVWVKNLESFPIVLHLIASSSSAYLDTIQPDGEWHLVGGSPTEVASQTFRIQKRTGDAGFSVALWGAQMTQTSTMRDYVPQSYTNPVIATLDFDEAVEIWLSNAIADGCAKIWTPGNIRAFSEGGVIIPTVIEP
jgi:hypothetical protein